MRGVRWLLVAGVALVGAVLAGAWLLPAFLDWNRFRDEIAALASDTLGGSVRIDGPVALTLLPQPMLTAARVTVAEGDRGVTVTAAQLRLRVGLWSLLSGRVDARELVLQGVDIRMPWPLEPESLIIHAPLWLSSLSARIEDGRLAVGNLVLTGIDATLTTGDYTGSYRVAGTAQLSGQPWRFTARMTRPGADGSAGLDVTLDGQGKLQGTGASLTGQIAGDGSLAGRIAGRGADLSQLLPAPPLPFRAEGRLTVAGGLAAADDLAVDLGGSPAQGAVALRVVPALRLDVAMTASRLDLDAWIPVLLRAPAVGAAPRLPIGIDLSAEAAQLAGGTLRGLRVAFDMAEGVVELRELRAVLPGEAGLRVAGRFAVPNEQPAAARAARFEGFVAVTAPTLRTTLAWLQAGGFAAVARLPSGVLRSAALAGHTVIDPGQIAIDGISGAVDDAAVSGGLTVRLGVRPKIGAGLTVDRLDLDAWLPEGLPALTAIPALLSAFDADVRLEAKQVVLHGTTFAPVSLDAAVEAGRLTLRKLDLLAAGVHASASGTVSETGRIAEGRLDVQASEAAPLAALLPDPVAFLGRRAPGLWRSPANLQVLASGAPELLGLRIAANVADLRLEALPTLDLRSGKWSGTLTLRHPGAPRLAEALGIAGAPTWLGDGSFSLVAQVSAGDQRLAADNFELTAGALRAGGMLALQRTESGSTLTGRVTAETLPLPLPYPRASDPLPIGLLSGWQGSVKLEAGQILLGLSPALQRVAATLTLAEGMLRVEGLSARLGGGALTGSFSLDTSAQPPAAMLDAQLAGASLSGPLFGLPLDLTAGALDATASLTAAGYSPAALLATLGGGLSLSVRNGMLAGIDLDRATGDLPDAGIRQALSGGSMAFDRLDVTARADHGSLQMTEAALRAASGTIGITGSIDLPGAAADLRLALRPAVPDPPEIGLRLNGPFDALRRIPELAAVARWRTGERGGRGQDTQTP